MGELLRVKYRRDELTLRKKYGEELIFNIVSSESQSKVE